MSEEGLWYKDAIIYQLHVKAFFDSDNDGVGDFAGLTSKLDYLQSLGVTALWLMPFYPSPLRDDGYDISDYTAVHPMYGTMRDFRRFVREAHARSLRVITELVINHTSDQHPWFQRSRHAQPGSAARNFYVWSDTDRTYAGTRIIFTDIEKSNWAFDPIANAYYWHRFFSHQPDLNYDNPRVLEEVIRVMRFWLAAGVDGLRLDAVPYLCEREGTNNENLPETHAIVRRIREELDHSHPNRMLLAEANQWPEDVLPYFGAGDECHMAFHFPLMPRLYMAIAQEDRHPITDIMRQTPDIPESCQWAVFLRNHDELTLEMVSDRERDYLWKFYATDTRMRHNLGIRRRLAPLTEGNRDQIELLQSLLMSMPGTPVMYYGDEIGMGDNIYLGDRNGVRTPMQWSPDRNGGFSRVDPARLYLPAIMDPLYGYQSLNVEAQTGRSTSLLNWTRRIIAVRKAHKAFGRGIIRFLHPGNRKVLVYVREYDDDLILCVANLSRSPQPVELSMPEYAGRVPVELLGRSVFPPVREQPYFLSLPGYGFYWFLLTTQTQAPEWHESSAPAVPEFLTLVIPQGWRSLQEGTSRWTLERTILPEFLATQRWFPWASEQVASVELAEAVEMPGTDMGWLISAWRLRLGDGAERRFFLPLAVAWERGGEDALAPHVAHALGRVRRVAAVGGLYDALYDEHFVRAIVRLMRERRELRTTAGSVRFTATRALDEWSEPDEAGPVRRVGQEQINTLVQVGEHKLLKAFRTLRDASRVELEVNCYLTEAARYPNAPRLLGAMELLDAQGQPTVLALLQELLTNQGDAWTYAQEYLMRYLDTVLASAAPAEQPANPHAAFAQMMYKLGVRTAELHWAFARETDDPAFKPEPLTKADIDHWCDRAWSRARLAQQVLQSVAGEQEESDELLCRDARRMLAGWEAVTRTLEELAPHVYAGAKTRYHGNLNLNQVLVEKDDFFLFAFEGEPSEDFDERREKGSPLRDVATVLRSFHNVGWAATLKTADAHPEAIETLLDNVLDWRREVAAGFLAGYRSAIQGCPSYPADAETEQQLLTLFRLEKALQEMIEAAPTAEALRIPIQAVLRITSAGGSTAVW